MNSLTTVVTEIFVICIYELCGFRYGFVILVFEQYLFKFSEETNFVHIILAQFYH